MTYIENPKTKGSGILCAIPQTGTCPVNCADCFFQTGRAYLEPLEKNLPNLPSLEDSLGRVVRMNDGNDSNNQREIVESAAARYHDVFFNTSMPKDLGGYPGPVVLTVNPGNMTDVRAHLLEEIPDNLMFVRVRVNTWNRDLVDRVVAYYTGKVRHGEFLGARPKDSKTVPVVLTFMAYYEETLPEIEQWKYVYRQRTLNSYWVLRDEIYQSIIGEYAGNPLVSMCGKDNRTYGCKSCGVCLREYFSTKERCRGMVR
jgi:hypothetical protein